jgi:DNA-binding transcriptional MocR family regulator
MCVDCRAVKAWGRRGLLDRNIKRLKAVYSPRLDVIVAALDEHIPESEWKELEGASS